jgi:hypothetical protein
MDNNKKFWIIIIAIIAAALILLVLVFNFPFNLPQMPRPSLPFVQEPQTSCIGTACPSDILNLNNWKLTLPISDTSDPENPQEIMQPELASYMLSPWFTSSRDKKAVLFRAAVNGITTDGSNYPRSELREMTNNGTKETFWPSTNGTHTLFLDEAITAVPKNKPAVVAGQIHGDDDDLLVIRLEYPKLFLNRGSSNLYTLDENYVLGKRFAVKFVAQNGEIKVYYNGGLDPVYTLEKKVRQAYFKVGVYPQSNCEQEKISDLCSADNYGEVAVYQADISHQ